MLILGEGAGPMSEIGRSRSEYDRRSSLGHEIRRRLPSLKFAAGTKFAVFRRGNSASINHVKFAYVFCIHPLHIFYFKFSDGHKRSSSVTDEGTEPAKKAKIEENVKVEKDIKVEFNNSINKTLKKLSREVCMILK